MLAPWSVTLPPPFALVAVISVMPEVVTTGRPAVVVKVRSSP